MASGGGGCSASERLPPPFPGLEPESEGAAGGSDPEVEDSDTEGEDIFTGAAATVSSQPSGRLAGRRPKGEESLWARVGEAGEWAPRPRVGDSSRPLCTLDECRDIVIPWTDCEEWESKPQSPKRTTTLLPFNNGSKENGIHEEQDQEPQDLFAGKYEVKIYTKNQYIYATVELSLDSTQNNQKKVPAKTLISQLPQEATNSKSQPSYEELEEEEQEDQFDLTVGITDPEKIGDGMNAYVAYKVTTQTSLPIFRSKQFAVKRRFSDFLGLYEKLSEKHSQNGFIVPPPPEKSLIGMTKVKVGKEDSSSAEFLEKRRAALERYLQRIVNHPTMLQDPDVREFLEKEELPRAVGTQTLSGAGLLKMFNKATDAVSKMTIKMNESDIWFEEKLQEVECEEQRLRKLHAVVETLVNHRKELALNTAQFAKSLAMLGSSEDNTALSRALSQLAEVEEKIEQLHQEQANNDFFLLAELLSDYIRLLAIVRAAFDQRMKTWQRWQDAQATLQKKREAEARLLWANKPDKLQQAKDEIVEWESRVTQYERDFERISTVVRKEVLRFEKEKSKDFKNHVVKYLETLLYSQQQVCQSCVTFLPLVPAPKTSHLPGASVTGWALLSSVLYCAVVVQ
ncbi:Sorting nexin-1 [Galemys pyrenaicus]|uniref:Sorting nexin-1 n=1 Tax=Galemys pyrenaicus TaxID=202257 RepID=A0A8J6DJC5_GALPY|nr:Sorting nexin-1 [Galemys pyrenaicus]